MKYRMIALLLVISLLLSGCSLFDGSYVNVTPYQKHGSTNLSEAISARNYFQLRSALENLVSTGTESSVIYVADYDSKLVEGNLQEALAYIQNDYPIGAYAVEEIACEVGTSSGKPAIALNITYRRSKSDLRRIEIVKNVEKAREAIGEALRDFDSVLVLKVENYTETDFLQLVEQYATEHPEYVMEVPLVTVDVFGKGLSRVVELIFTYQNNRDSLKQMKNQVQPMFDAAALYVTGGAQERQKYSQLYSFLMERFDYKLETSITPAYSLLCHGVGDSRAFALVYASMCRRAGLDCRIVTGTRNAEPWTWNMVKDNGTYFHVDLIRCYALGGFQELVDAEMAGYVWDYSAYPTNSGPQYRPAQPEDSFIPTQAAEASGEK